MAAILQLIGRPRQAALVYIVHLYKYSCSSAISISERKENKQRFQTLLTDNAWSKKLNINLTFRMLQHTSSEVTVTTITQNLKKKSEALVTS